MEVLKLESRKSVLRGSHSHLTMECVPYSLAGDHLVTCCGRFYTDHDCELRMILYFFKWFFKKIKGRIICNILKLFAIQISVSLKKVLLEHSNAYSFIYHSTHDNPELSTIHGIPNTHQPEIITVWPCREKVCHLLCHCQCLSWVAAGISYPQPKIMDEL